MQHRQRLFVRCAALDGRGQQAPGALDIAVVEGLESLVHEPFGLTLPLGLRAARTIDVGAGAVVCTIQEEHACPDVDGVIHAAGEVLVETRDEELLDARLAFGIGQRKSERRVTGRRVDHACKSLRV